MNYNHYQDNITILQNKGNKIAQESQQQPHSKIVIMDCGCMINSEFFIGNPQAASAMNKKFAQEGFRQWICPCREHAKDPDLIGK